MELRRYWPFPIPLAARDSTETRRQVSFLEQAAEEGYTAYSDEGGLLGGLAPNGRQGEIIHRGNGRYWEVVLAEGSHQFDTFYVDGFEHAAEAVLRWLRGEGCPDIKFSIQAAIVQRPGQRGG